MASQVWTMLGSRSAQGAGAAADTFASGASDGMPLDGVGAFAVFAEADAGQTISTAVNAKAWVQDPISLRWGRAEQYDITGMTVTGIRTAMLGGFVVDAPIGRIAYENNGGVVSSGSLTFRLVASGRLGTIQAGTLL